MKRREFIASSLAAGAIAGLAQTGVAQAGVAGAKRSVPQRKTRFKLQYAPHFGMFRHSAGDDPVEQLRFMADRGFAALEDNGMRERPPQIQQRIADEMERLGMTMGVFVATADFGNVTFASGDPDVRRKLLADIEASVETARRVNATWCTVVPGCCDQRRAWDYQTANVIENLKGCAEVCEPAGLVMVLEPLNPRDHPGLFLTKIPQAFMICQAVGSPSCKILDDLYHQQVTEGNLLPNIDAAWSEIAYFQVGDNPGRKEPTTGEINYRNIFGRLHARGYAGIIGMEHGNSRPGAEGEQAVIDAYVECDSF